MTNTKYQEPSGHALRAYEVHYRFHASLLTAAIEAGKEAIKAALLLNGSACIALLSFLAVITARDSSRSVLLLIQPTKEALAYFAFGSLAAALGSGLAFASYCLRANSEAHRDMKDEFPFIFECPTSKRFMLCSDIATGCAVFLVVGSYLIFAYALISIAAKL